MSRSPAGYCNCGHGRVVAAALGNRGWNRGFEGLGPSAGTPKKLGAVVVSADAFAADAVSCHLMGHAAADIPHLRLGAERHFGIIKLESLRVSPSDWACGADPFVRPPSEISINFPGVRVLDQNSCSACQSTLLMFLKRYGENMFDYFRETDARLHRDWQGT